MMQNEGGSCNQSMQPEACEAGQCGRGSFKLRIVGKAEIPQQTSEEVVDVVGKSRVRGNDNLKDTPFNKTMHARKEMPVVQCYRES